jgi:acetyl esterase
MALDEATSGFLASMAEAGGKPLHEMQPAEARALGPMLMELSGPGPEVASVAEEALTGWDGGSFRVRTLIPAGTPQGIFVYYHGGGWVIGDIDQYDGLGRELANRTNTAVVLVDYRKAPENQYPAAVEDSWTALNWVSEHMSDIAGAEVPLIVGGDSAGGNLAAIMAQRSRDRSGPAIALQVLVYPVTDADLDNKTYSAPANQLMLSRDSMVWFWDYYVPDKSARSELDVSPAQSKDLSGLPPAVVLTAEHDVLREEGEAYANALQSAGVPTQSRRFEGQMHGFFSMVNILPGAATGMDYVSEAVNERLATLSP